MCRNCSTRTRKERREGKVFEGEEDYTAGGIVCPRCRRLLVAETPADRIQLVGRILSKPRRNRPRGAGINLVNTQRTEPCIESIFPLHDHDFNAAFLRRWAKPWNAMFERMKASEREGRASADSQQLQASTKKG